MGFLRKNITDITIFILLQYIFIAAILMYLYSGGSILQPYNKQYVLNLNFLNDLGRTYYFDGQKNLFWIYYSFSLFLIGIGIILFFYLISHLLRHKQVRLVILFFGIISGMSYMVLAFIPIDINFEQNIMASKIGVYSYLLANLFFNFFLNKDKYRFLYYLTLVFNLILICLIFYQAFLLKYHDPVFALKFKVVIQKLVAFFRLATASLILYYIKRKRLYY